MGEGGIVAGVEAVAGMGEGGKVAAVEAEEVDAAGDGGRGGCG